MPRPPPPPEALRMIGKPIRFASSIAWSASRSTSLPGSSGKPVFARVAARRDLVAPRPHRLRRWTDERDVALAAKARELGVLGEEAVAGVNRVGAGDLRRRHDRWNMQVTAERRRRADAHRFVGEADVKRARVGLGVDGDRGDAELAACADHAERDLTAVRDQDLLERRRRGRRDRRTNRRRTVVTHVRPS